MNSKKWFGQAIEIGVLGLIIYCVTLVIWQVSPPPEGLKFKIFIRTVIPNLNTSIGALVFIKILKQMSQSWPAIIIESIKRLDQNLCILNFIIFSIIAPISLLESLSVFNYFYSSIVDFFTKKPELILNPLIASLLAIPLLILLLILGLPLLLIVWVIYIIIQSRSPKYNPILANFLFFTVRILKIMGLVLLAVTSYTPAIVFLVLLITYLAIAPLSIIDYSVDPNLLLNLTAKYFNVSPDSYSPLPVKEFPWWTIPYALLKWVVGFLMMAFTVINGLTFLCFGIIKILTIILRIFFPVGFKLNVNRAISDFIWSFVYNLINFIEFLSPFLIFSDALKIGIVDAGLSYALASDSTPSSAKMRKFAAKFAQNYVNAKNKFFPVDIFGVDDKKFKLVSSIAAKLLLLGDLKQADIIYSSLWESAKNLTKSGKKVVPSLIDNIFVVPSLIDNIFSEVCYYYIETSQYKPLNSVINYSNRLVQKNQLSELSYIANFMRADFARNAYSDKADKAVVECLSWGKIVRILISLPDVFNYNDTNTILWKAKAPEDFFKNFISFMFMEDEENEEDDDEEYEEDEDELMFIKNNQQDLIILLNTLRLIFVTQSKIYRFICTQDSNYLPVKEEIDAALIKRQSLNILGIKISIDNSFVKDNVKLIPIVYLLASDSKSVNLFGNQRLEEGLEELLKKILKESIESAQKNGREMELAFFQCCQGKILMNTGSIENGLNKLLAGIKTYEGIRHSVNTDQLGLGFGSSYLEYYDWAIDALIQLGNLSLAFEYTERATARAILDLVSRKTSRLGSINQSNQVAQLIGEIQNLDFTIYFSQSSIYEAPFIAKFPPLKPRLEKKFYTDKKQRLKHLLKNRDSLVAELKAIDPVSATLVEVKPLTWKTSSKSEENSIPFDVLWNSQTIAETETILCFHVIHKVSFAKHKPWDKIVCFAMYNENGSLQLHHHVVDDPETVAKLQPVSQGIASEVEKRDLNLKTKSLDPLSNNLIIPLLQHLPIRCNSLTIVANSDLQFFPWSILYDGDDKQLIERFRIRTTPSLSLMYLLKQREDLRHTDIPTKFLVAGVEQYPDPREYLFWSGVEINRISQLYDSPSVLKDADVDEDFANKFKQAEVIHYSGHGNYRKSDSEQDALDKTYLCLYNKTISATQILDGALENPAAKVMILSACLTGQGDLTRSGSEILGLERALFHAGLSSLVTTLWSVDDFATALLMLKLHLVWRQQNNSLETLADSLREAQLWLKNLSWQQLKQEFPEIERDVYNCLATYQTRITYARANEDEDAAKKFENNLKYYQNALKRIQSKSRMKIFIGDYYWAAFQVKGLG
ncbi:MAG: CHAT domain-containing protein [Microcoleus sp. PH2017_22_RUC_O_B]|uniref:CHAT domain-containing protein n=1 Tax=unclassified Microcoleus TaxID=2642155 RepID=UPI001E03C214|nr:MULTISPECIES: CHAT domain-containing protein [unclassified Microcoleus]MCC3527664.1 CHAT domain-containing protein [Microcoleus sp. PH2017_21_RUC_O_A]MCC3539766.1 CHAT domain-containing protein [Microcoleus sp. PH2017_22_RUC_O_B]